MYIGIREMYPKINKNVGKYLALCRPFTLVAPMLAGLLGVLIERKVNNGNGDLLFVILAMLVIALLQATGQIVNQITDLEQDLINKPYRPLTQGVISARSAWVVATTLAVLALLLSLPLGWRFTCFSALILIFAWSYSLDPVRIKKRNAWLALLWMAVSRGLFPFLLTWSLYGTLLDTPLPWQLGVTATAWVVAFQATKDFADYEGDYECNIPTLVTNYHKRTTLEIMTVLFVYYLVLGSVLLPFPLILALLPNASIGIFILRSLTTESTTKKLENNYGWVGFYAGVGVFYLSVFLLI